MMKIKRICWPSVSLKDFLRKPQLLQMMNSKKHKNQEQFSEATSFLASLPIST
jgi:hypothetical protein